MTTPSAPQPDASPATEAYRSARDQLLGWHGRPDLAREHLAPYLRVRRLEFYELPKTISGKIRRVELRAREEELARSTSAVRPGTVGAGGVGAVGQEFRDTDFPELRG